MTDASRESDASFDVPDPYLQTPFDPTDFPTAEDCGWYADENPDVRIEAMTQEMVALRLSVDDLTRKITPGVDRTTIILMAMTAFLCGATFMVVLGDF